MTSRPQTLEQQSGNQMPRKITAKRATRAACVILLITVGLSLFFWAVLKVLGREVWTSNIAFDREGQSPVIQLQPGSHSRVGIFLRVEAVDPSPHRKGVTYAYPLSYKVLDSHNRVIQAETTVVSSEDEKKSVSKTTGLESGTHLFASFLAPDDGRINLIYLLSSKDITKSTTASSASVFLFDLMTPIEKMLPLILVSIVLMLGGILLGSTAFW
jgi:hypothetical protein